LVLSNFSTDLYCSNVVHGTPKIEKVILVLRLPLPLTSCLLPIPPLLLLGRHAASLLVLHPPLSAPPGTRGRRACAGYIVVCVSGNIKFPSRMAANIPHHLTASYSSHTHDLTVGRLFEQHFDNQVLILPA
jgi:hypothetical protein